MENLHNFYHLARIRHLRLFFRITQYVIKLWQEKGKAFYSGLLSGIFLIITMTVSFAQGTIQGNVKNLKGQAIAFANILLLNQNDSSLIKGIVCDESGNYNLSQIPKGSYLISAHMMGFQTFFSNPVSVEVNNSQTMEFILKEEISELSEVLVSAKKPLFEQQMGKFVVNVNSSIISSGSTVLEVLSRTPGILVNPQNNSITMNGKGGVMVMLNGKLVRLPLNAVVQMLSGMNADQVSTIEIINSPPARYDAEGNAGLINIISTQNLEVGTNGSFSGNFGTSFDQETLERFGGSMNINHRGKKVSFYLNTTYTKNFGRSGIKSVKKAAGSEAERNRVQ